MIIKIIKFVNAKIVEIVKYYQGSNKRSAFEIKNLQLTVLLDGWMLG